MYYYIHHTMGIILNRVDTSMISVNLKHSFSQSFNKIWEGDMDVSVKVQGYLTEPAEVRGQWKIRLQIVVWDN